MIIQNSQSSKVVTPASPAPVSVSVPSTPTAPVAPRTPVKADSADAKVQPGVPTESVTKVVAAVNESLRRSGSALQFRIDRATDTAVVSMVDSDTGQVIRQIPSEEALAIARSIDEMLQRMGASCGSGILCKQTA